MVIQLHSVRASADVKIFYESCSNGYYTRMGLYRTYLTSVPRCKRLSLTKKPTHYNPVAAVGSIVEYGSLRAAVSPAAVTNAEAISESSVLHLACSFSE